MIFQAKVGKGGIKMVNLLLHAYRQQILHSLLSTSGYDASVPPDFEMGKSPL